MERHRLHERARLAPPAAYDPGEVRPRDARSAPIGDEPLRVGEEEELVEPRGEERREVARGEVDGALDDLAVGGAEELRERPQRLEEHSLRRLRLELHLELRRVVDEAVHAPRL